MTRPPATPLDPGPGDLPPRFRWKSLLGRGGMGRVDLAEDLQLKRDVALKRLSLGPDTPALLRQRFQREARIHAGVVHPHLVRMYDFVEDGAASFLVMEPVPGRPLSEAVRAARGLAWDQISRIVRQVGAALDALHAHGALHRDVKPANIMLRPDGAAVLMDLGLARDAASPTLTGADSVVGTPCFFPPELLRGEALGPRSDLYQLGLVAYFAAHGQHWFDPRQDLVDVARQILDRDADPDLGSVPPGVAAWLRRAVDPRPGRRFENGDQLARGLEAALGGTHQAPASAPEVSQGSRLPAAALGAAALLTTWAWARSGAPAGPPVLQDLWAIQEDRVVVLADGRERPGLALEVDGRQVGPEVLGDHRLRFEAALDPSAGGHAARLVWDGGRSIQRSLRANGRPLGGLTLHPSGAVEAEVRRPALVGWGEDLADAVVARPPAVRLAAPAVGRAPVLWYREGRRSQPLRLSWEDLVEDLEARLSAEAQPAARFAAWARWAERLLAADVPTPTRREVLARLVSSGEALGAAPAPPAGVPPGRPGSTFEGPVELDQVLDARPLPLTSRFDRDPDPTYDRVDGDATSAWKLGGPPELYQLDGLVSPRHGALDWAWPEAPPGLASAVCVAVEFLDLPHDASLRFVDGAGLPLFALGRPPGSAIPRSPEEARTGTWASLCLPPDLSPPPGARGRLELRPSGAREKVRARIRRARVAWVGR